jgi:hypothetical protein
MPPRNYYESVCVSGLFLCVSWPIISDALTNAGKNSYFLVTLLTNSGSSFENNGSPIWELPSEVLKLWAEANQSIVPYILHFMSLFIAHKGKSENEEFSWHPHALLLLEIGDIYEVIGCVQANLATFGSSGSRVPYLEKRIALLEFLAAKDTPRFKQIASTIMITFKDLLERAKKQDEHHAAGIY